MEVDQKKAGPQSFIFHISEMGSQGQDGDSENTIHNNILQLLLGVSQKLVDCSLWGEGQTLPYNAGLDWFHI